MFRANGSICIAQQLSGPTRKTSMRRLWFLNGHDDHLTPRYRSKRTFLLSEVRDFKTHLATLPSSCFHSVSKKKVFLSFILALPVDSLARVTRRVRLGGISCSFRSEHSRFFQRSFGNPRNCDIPLFPAETKSDQSSVPLHNLR